MHTVTVRPFKQESKMKYTESKTERWLRTGFILFLAILLMLIIFSGTGKGSDVSNWIIAFANIAMAATAIVAWRRARKFLGEFFAQEGYRLAIELINENVIHLGLDNKFTVRVNEAVHICSVLPDVKYEVEKYHRLKDALKQLEELQNNNTVLLSNLLSLSFRMETYGIYAAEDKKGALNDMVLALDEMNRMGGMLLCYLCEDAEAYNAKLQSDSGLLQPFSSRNLEKIKALQNPINHAWNVMVKNRTLFLSDGKHARTLFVVKDN